MANFLAFFVILQEEFKDQRRNVYTQAGEKREQQKGKRTSLPGDKGPIPRDKEKKGRDASGASSGAEALIAAPIMLNYECFRM